MNYTSEFTTQEVRPYVNLLLKLPLFVTKFVFNWFIVDFSRSQFVNQWARGVGRRNGFINIIKVSNAARIGVKDRVLLACERSGQYKHGRNNEKGLK